MFVLNAFQFSMITGELLKIEFSFFADAHSLENLFIACGDTYNSDYLSDKLF